MSFLSNAKSYKTTLMLGAMLAVGIGLTGCDDEKGGIEPNPEPTLPMEKSVTVPASNIKLGYVGQQLVFASSRTVGDSWGNIDSDVMDSGNIRVQFDASSIDSVYTDNFGTVRYRDREGGRVKARISLANDKPVVSDGIKEYSSLIIEAEELACLNNNTNASQTTMKEFVKSAADIPFSVKPVKFEGLYQGKKLTLN